MEKKDKLMISDIGNRCQNLSCRFLKLSFILLSFFISTAAFASTHSGEISIQIDNATVHDILQRLEETSNYSFLYNNDLIDVNRKVSVNVKSGSIDQVIKQLFKNSPVTYKLINRQVILSPVNQVKKDGDKIKGKVIDSDHKPIPGVTVMVKGTTRGTITGIDGDYEIKADPSETLQFSFIGKTSQEVLVGKKEQINVTLEENNIGVNEVVVVGYGTTTRKNFTGSVSEVDMDKSPIALTPHTDALDALKGTVTGLTVSQQVGAGQSPSLLVRGQKSVSDDATDPLVVLDGVIFMGSMRDIDPSTIQSISVLKDASSIAVYGSRAANGVVMITTKKGKVGKPIINFSTSLGFSTVINKADLLSPENWIKKVNLLQGLDEDADPTSWMSDFETENYEKGKTTDWQDFAERNGFVQNYSLSMSGATDRINYFMSASYANTEGVVIGDDYNRTALTSRLTTHITDWLEVGGDVNYSFNDYSGPTTYNIYTAIRLTPYGRAYRDDETRDLERYPATEGTYRTNPLWDVKSGTIDDHDVYYTTILNGHALIKCPWIKGLSYRLNYSYTNKLIERDYFKHEGYFVAEGTSDDRYSSSAISDYLTSANGYSARTKDIAWVWDNIITYQRQFGKHFINATGVYTRDSYSYNYKKVTGSDFSEVGNTELGYNGLAYAATQQIDSYSNTLKTDVGYLLRVNYNYDDKYHITGSVRRDGASVFGDDDKWGVFPSVGIGWTLSKENFMKSVPAISYLKWKLSWGLNGNQSLDPYETLSTLTLGETGGYSYPFGNTSEVSWGQRISSLGNPELGWEQTSAFNTGFELTAFNKRINLSFDAYKSKTTNQIFDRTIPIMGSGISSVKATMGQVNNWGLEFTLTSHNIQSRNFTWSSTLNYSINRNKLIELYGTGEDDVSSSLFIGKSLGAIYGYKQIGIVQEDDADYIEANGAVAGDVKFKDLNGDGSIDSDDRTILGYDKAGFRASLANTFSYKNFEFYFLINGIFGGRNYYKETNIYAYRTASDVTYDNNFNHIWWTEENASNKYPRVDYTDSRYTPVQSRTFVRLQNVSLSYSFHQPWVQRLKLKQLRTYFAATNLLTLTGWEGGDPETGVTLGSGYSYGYPLAATYTFGINLTF